MPARFSERGRWAIVIAALIYVVSSYGDQDIFPVLTIDVQISDGEIPVLKLLMSDFARQNGFAFSDYGEQLTSTEGKSVMFLKLTRDDGVSIRVLDYMSANRFPISIYDDETTGRWGDVSDSLVRQLKERWPGNLTLKTPPKH